MLKKLFAGVGAAALLLLTFSTSAHAALETPSENLVEPISVDASQIVRDFTATTTGTLTSVSVMVDFLAHDGEDCSIPFSEGISYPHELGIALVSPAGTVVSLVYPWSGGEGMEEYVEGTYYEWDAIPTRVQVTFDDGAAEAVGASSAGVPVTGTFQPVEPLSAFLGQEASGVWQIVFTDVAEADAKCYYGASLMLETADATVPVVTAPTPPAKIETSVQ